MIKIESFILCLLFPIMVYGKGSMRDTVRIQVHKQTYELTMSVDSAKGGCAQSPVIVSVKLTKEGKPAGESIFPLPGNCNSDALHRHHAVNIPLDADKRLSSFSDK